MINREDTKIQIPVAGMHPEVHSLNVLYCHLPESEAKGLGEPQCGQGLAFLEISRSQSGQIPSGSGTISRSSHHPQMAHAVYNATPPNNIKNHVGNSAWRAANKFKKGDSGTPASMNHKPPAEYSPHRTCQRGSKELD